MCAVVIGGKYQILTFDSEKSYAQVTNSLQRMQRFLQDDQQYHDSETALRPIDPHQHPIMIADAAPRVIAASIYQVDKEEIWVAVDHAGRGMSISHAFVRCCSLL